MRQFSLWNSGFTRLTRSLQSHCVLKPSGLPDVSWVCGLIRRHLEEHESVHFAACEEYVTAKTDKHSQTFFPFQTLLGEVFKDTLTSKSCQTAHSRPAFHEWCCHRIKGKQWSEHGSCRRRTSRRDSWLLNLTFEATDEKTFPNSRGLKRHHTVRWSNTFYWLFTKPGHLLGCSVSFGWEHKTITWNRKWLMQNSKGEFINDKFCYRPSDWHRKLHI